MSDKLKQQSIELVKETGASLWQATLWSLNALGAVLELLARWIAYFLERGVRWTVNTGAPMAWSGLTTAASLAVDFSLVTIQVVSVTAISVGGFLRGAIANRS